LRTLCHLQTARSGSRQARASTVSNRCPCQRVNDIQQQREIPVSLQEKDRARSRTPYVAYTARLPSCVAGACAAAPRVAHCQSTPQVAPCLSGAPINKSDALQLLCVRHHKNRAGRRAPAQRYVQPIGRTRCARTRRDSCEHERVGAEACCAFHVRHYNTMDAMAPDPDGVIVESAVLRLVPSEGPPQQLELEGASALASVCQHG
jgi:hypothetical protein